MITKETYECQECKKEDVTNETKLKVHENNTKLNRVVTELTIHCKRSQQRKPP